MPTQQGAQGELIELVERHHDAAARALHDPGHSLDAVAWISTHLAAVDRALYPAARHLAAQQRQPHGGRRLLRLQCAVDRELLRAVWQLDRRLTGDVHNAPVPLSALVDEVQRRLADHAAGERRLVDAVADLDEGVQRDILAQLRETTARAPTRPHPFAPHAPVVAKLAFRVDALVDRVRDALDARHVPVPRRRRQPRRPGRWGLYALGTADVYPDADVASAENRLPTPR